MLLSSIPQVPGFDISKTAQMYSTLAGVLAGFSFAGIITIATFKPEKESLLSKLLTTARPGKNAQPGSPEPATDAPAGLPFALVVRVLGAAFLGLIIVSLSYASLSGTTDTAGAEVSDEIILGPAFAASAVQVFYALVLLTESLDTPYFKGKTALRIRPIVARWATLLAVFFVFDSARDYETLRYHGHYTYITFFGVTFGVVQLIVSLVLYPFWSGQLPYWPAKRVREWTQDTKDLTIRWLTATAFALTVISGLCYAAFDALSDETTMTWPLIPITTMGLTLLIMTGTTYQLARSAKREAAEGPKPANPRGRRKKHIAGSDPR
jgi:hypothetical protein